MFFKIFGRLIRVELRSPIKIELDILRRIREQQEDSVHRRLEGQTMQALGISNAFKRAYLEH
jgi:hypothetical protein